MSKTLKISVCIPFRTQGSMQVIHSLCLFVITMVFTCKMEECIEALLYNQSPCCFSCICLLFVQKMQFCYTTLTMRTVVQFQKKNWFSTWISTDLGRQNDRITSQSQKLCLEGTSEERIVQSFPQSVTTLDAELCQPWVCLSKS